MDRDQVEDAELSRREAQEEMPKNVQDFKDHPYYVLERHLKHNEVIHPKREVGKVNVGTAANTNLEPIYRRRDVHQLKSADKWYRLGREIKPGEQPLKHAKPRRTRQQQPFPEEDENGEETLGAALYAPFQTELYVPPPCVRGRVPRNAFGNLDVYVPSMVPPGGLHIRDSRTRLAARLLGIDHADAVTGFSFRGRHGTAVVEGAVVAAEFGDAVLAVLDGLRDLEQEEAEEKRSREALRLWRKFLLGLRVLERVQEYASADEKKQMEQEVRERVEAEEREAEMAAREQEMAGGFLLAEGAGDAPAEPTAGRMLAAAALDEDEYYDGGDGGGFLPDAADGEEVEEGEGEQGFDGAGDEGDVPIGGGGFVPDEAEKSGYDPDEAGGFIPEDGDGFGPEGGGFVPEESSGGGGFIPEDGGGFVPEEGGGFIPDEEEGGEGGGIPVPQASKSEAP
ncbi:putative dna repair protein [Neofusicoccum parvum UCRNP2]|uniref:Putative dna repair protein n=1 Tax=Botryosphaeria parva (strain UCR-NP2) TaxID=1287680 RepID=R1GLR9_BOTPV|nr:putative dna repair protein [Neofusicoccum parvum UCRNP2]